MFFSIGIKKQEVVPCIYDETDGTYYILKVKPDSKWGAFSKDGNEIIPCRYDFIGYELSDSLLYVIDNNKHSLIHFDGREIVPCVYNEQLRSNSSTAFLKAVLYGKYGFIDRRGKEIIPIEYDNVDFIAERGFWADLKGEKVYFNLQSKMVDNDLTAVAQVQASKSNGKMMKVNYNSQDKTFTFIDADTGKTLEYNYIMIGNHADKICSVLKKNDCGDIINSSASKLFKVISWSEVGLSYFISNAVVLLFFPAWIHYLSLINVCSLPYTFWSIKYIILFQTPPYF